MGKAKTPSVKHVTTLQLERWRRYAAPVLEAANPMKFVRKALRAGGYGGDLRPALLTYLAVTSRLLAMRSGMMPAHLLLVGQPSSGKSYTMRAVQRLLPSSAYHLIEAGSSRVVIYENADLRHRALFFGEADSLPAGEDNPAASAIRNLLQDNELHYKVSIRDPRKGGYRVRHIKKRGPTVLITTSTRRLGEQLESRLFCVDMREDHRQVRKALRMQARLESKPAPKRSKPLVAYQAYLQALAPWVVCVPYADKLAEVIGRSPAESRVVRDFSRLLALIKAAAVLRHRHRRKNAKGQLVATRSDYKLVYKLVREVYKASASGAGDRVRAVVDTVTTLQRAAGKKPITETMVANHLKTSKMAVSRHVQRALAGGWLVNDDPRPRRYDLRIGEPLPDERGLPRPETL